LVADVGGDGAWFADLISFRYRLLAALVLLVCPWGSLAAIDAISERVQQSAEADAPPARRDGGHLPPGRVFVLIIDSLRAQSAENVPALQDLRRRSLFVRIKAIQAATVPSLRAAFTGVRQRSIFGFVGNFVHGTRTVPSIFTQLAAVGGRTAVFTDLSFFELAPGVADLHPNQDPPGDEETSERRALARALDLWNTREHQLMVFHYTAIDHVAHQHPITDPVYRHAFEVADQVVRQVDEAVGPDDTLVVMGDHGHDETGRHHPGLDVPTIGIYRGPRYQAGVETGPAGLQIHRYLMSWGLGLPLARGYRGVGAPGLLGATPLPAAYAAPPSDIAPVRNWPTRLIYFIPLVLIVACASLAAAIALDVRPDGSAARILGATFAGAGFFELLGAFLANRRLNVRPATVYDILGSWGVALLIAVGLTLTGRRRTATWLLLLVPGLLLYPSPAWFGWAAIMGPAWFIALVLLAVDWARRRFILREGPGVTTQERLALLALPAVGAALLHFVYAETDGVVAGSWRGYLTSNSWTYWIVLSLLARLVIFVRPGKSAAVNVTAVLLSLFFTLVSFGDLLPSGPAQLAAACFMASAAWIARGISTRDVLRGRPPGTAAGLYLALGSGALLLFYRATVVLEERTLLEMEILLAALRLSAIVGKTLGAERDRRWFAVWLEAAALLVAVWSTLALTLNRLEWAILYRFFEPTAVMHHVGWLMPVILFRYAIPLILARRLLAEAQPPDARGTWRAACVILTARLATLVLMVIGMGVLDPSNEPFRTAVQSVVTVSVLALALLMNPRPVDSLALG
jgi:hypothetical protein